MPALFLFLILAFSLAAQDIQLRPEAAFTGQTPAALWTNGIVPYVLDPDVPSPTRFTDAVAYYNASTPLHFQPRASETNYVHVIRSTIGNGICTSAVGMVGGEQFIHVEDACTTATLIHEMGHSVGFFHEQSRHDRNLHVTVLYENINKSGYSDFGANSPPLEQDIGVYDFASHMHYSTFEFSAANLPVMQTVPAGIPLDSYTVLSPGDLDSLFRMYGKPPTATTLVTNPPGLQFTLDGQTVTSPQVLNWSAGSTHTVSASTQTSGPTRYLFARWSDDGAASHTITADPAVTFYSLDFIQQVPVTVGVAASGGGTATLDVASPDGYVATGTVFTMAATPAPGYAFYHWSGGTACPRVNSATPTSFTVGSTAISCQAIFTQSAVTTIVTDPLDIPVTIDNAIYQQTPVNVIWTTGSTHTIATAAPASNATSAVRYIFQGWSDGGAATHTVTASTATTIKASYKTQYSLVVPAASPGTVGVTVSPQSPDGFYDAGTHLQITAVPVSGYNFFQWTRDLAGQPNPALLTMDSQKIFGVSVLQNQPSMAIASAASLANTAVAPGELITLFRSPASQNPIGPDTLALSQLDSSGKLATTAGGVSVTINGQPAPVVYASANQTAAIMPYSVANFSSGTPLVFQVQYNGNSTVASAITDLTAPGLFTAAANGLGQVLAANQDGTLNSATNPAHRGSIVTFYGTGAGQLTPAGVDGEITGLPLPTLTQPVSLRIGGKPAQLPYAGPAPAQVSGVLQVNAVVPQDAPAGPDSVYLVIGLNSSPTGVTLWVN